MHGVEREHPFRQPQRGDQRLRRRDFVEFLVDDLMGEDDLVIDGEGTEDMRRLAVGKSIEALPKRLAVDGDEAEMCSGASPVQTLGMASKSAFRVIGVDLLQDAAHRGVGRCPPKRGARESRGEQRKPAVDQGVDLPVGARPAQHGDDRELDQAGLTVDFALRTAAVGDRGKAGRKIVGGWHDATSESDFSL